MGRLLGPLPRAFLPSWGLGIGLGWTWKHRAVCRERSDPRLKGSRLGIHAVLLGMLPLLLAKKSFLTRRIARA